MSADIDIGTMGDHDLLVVAVTKLNTFDEKLDRACAGGEDRERRIILLEASQGAPPNGKKALVGNVASGGVAGLIVSVAVGIIEYFRLK